MALREKIKDRNIANSKSIQTPEASVAFESDEPLQVCSDLCFPLMYKNEEYFSLACKIYDDFVEKLSIKSQLTEEMIREVVVKHISEYSLPKSGLKIEIADFVTDNLLNYGPISTIMKIAGPDLNDILVNTKDYRCYL